MRGYRPLQTFPSYHTNYQLIFRPFLSNLQAASTIPRIDKGQILPRRIRQPVHLLYRRGRLIRHPILWEELGQVQRDFPVYRRQPLGQGAHLVHTVILAGNQEGGHLHMAPFRRQGNGTLHRLKIPAQPLVPLRREAFQVDVSLNNLHQRIQR